jgi:hypothetical protein
VSEITFEKDLAKLAYWRLADGRNRKLVIKRGRLAWTALSSRSRLIAVPVNVTESLISVDVQGVVLPSAEVIALR